MTINILNPTQPIKVFIGQGKSGGAFGIADASRYTIAVQLPSEGDDLYGLFGIDRVSSVRIDDPSQIVDRLGNPVQELDEANSCVFIKGATETRFWLTIQGDHPLWAQPKFKNGGRVNPHRLSTFYLEEGESTWKPGPPLVFRLELKQVLDFANPFAIDLGTTNTCAAYIAGEPPDIKLFTFDGKTSLPSLVLYPPPGKGDLVIGDKANLRDDLPIRSFKRYMGVAKHRFYLTDDRPVTPVEVYRDFLKRYLGEFEARIPTRLRKISATYPPDYSIQAKGAAVEVYQSLGIETEPDPFRVDEASAAAVYYVWERLNECGKNVETYRANYGDDHTLLVFDLGGGTTDISIVNVRVNFVPDGNRKVQEIEMRVIATASLLNVGGDNFTLEVLKAIKCHIALRAAEIYQRSRVIPESASEAAGNALVELSDRLDSFRNALQSTSEDLSELRQLERLAEHIVPTAWKRFEQGEDADPFARLRAHLAFHQLWKIAEQVKVRLVEGDENRLQLGTYEQILRLSQFGISQTEEFVLGRDTDLHRRIRPSVLKAVKACRHLATSSYSTNVELNSIQLAGNSSRIPLVEQLMKTEFSQDFHNVDKMVKFNKESAKSSVAFGACIASYLNDFGMQLPIRMKFNSVPERLGWEIGIYNPEFGIPFTPYFHADAKPSERPTYELDDSKPVALSLFRRRAGDEGSPQFLGKFLLHTEPSLIQGLPPIPEGKLQLILTRADALQLRRGDYLWKMHVPDRGHEPDDPFSGLN